MKTRKRLRIFSVLLLVCFFSPLLSASAADPPKTPPVAAKVKATPPQSITDALSLVEADRQALAASDAAIAQAQKTLTGATQSKGAAATAFAADTAAFQLLWNSIYGPPAPPPQPLPTPTPTPIPSPTPQPTPGGHLVGFVEVYSANCPPCVEQKPILDSLVADGVAVKAILNTDPDAASYKTTAWPTIIVTVDGTEGVRSVGLWGCRRRGGQ